MGCTVISWPLILTVQQVELVSVSKGLFYECIANFYLICIFSLIFFIYLFFCNATFFFFPTFYVLHCTKRFATYYFKYSCV